MMQDALFHAFTGDRIIIVLICILSKKASITNFNEHHTRDTNIECSNDHMVICPNGYIAKYGDLILEKK